LKQKYSNAKVFIATSGKVDGDRSPFTFDEKKKMMMLAGVDASAIVQTKSPYQSIEIMERFDKDTTVMVFAVSEKDMAEDPRFDFSNGLKLKKNGEPAYLQKWTNLNDAETFGTRGYIATTPTFPFEVLGQKINSASQIRNMISKSDDTKLTQLLQDLYNVTDVPQDVIELFKNKIGNTETMNENWDEHSFSKYLKENVIEDNIMKDTILQALTEGKSPHKKGTKKYKAHMAAMHAESIEEEFDRKVKEVLESSADTDEKLEFIHNVLQNADGDGHNDELMVTKAQFYVGQIKPRNEEDKKKLSYIATTLSASTDEDSYFDQTMVDQAMEYVEDIIERPVDESVNEADVDLKPIEGSFDWVNSMSDGTLETLKSAMNNDWDMLDGIKDLADFKRTIDIFFTNEETPVPEDIAKIFNKLLARDEKDIAKFNEFIRRAFIDAGEELEELETMYETTDHEVSMARKDVSRLAKYSSELEQMLSNVSEEEGLQGWVQAKITKAADYISSVKHYMEGDTTEVNEAVRDSSEGFGGQAINFIHDLCMLHDGVKRDPAGLKYLGKSEMWDEGSILKDKGKLTTLMLWVKKNKDVVEKRFSRMFGNYSNRDENGKVTASDGNQMLNDIINKIGSIGEQTVKGPRGHLSSIVADDLNEIDCWDGYRKDGTKPGTGKNKGKRVNNCVKEAGGYYTQPVYDMIKQHGYPKVMHKLLTSLHADVIQDFLNRVDLDEASLNESGPDESVKNIDEILVKMGAEAPSDIIADIMHWIDAHPGENLEDLIRQANGYYNDELEEGKYVSDAQRKAVHASKAEKK